MIGQDTGHGEYGPNSAEVERFLALLERLTPAEWTQVEADAPTTAPSPSPVERAIDFSSGDAKRAGDVAAELAPRSGGGDLPARTAAEALVLREELGEHFTLYYQPFVGVIPLECLGVTDCGHEAHSGLFLPRRAGRVSDGSE